MALTEEQLKQRENGIGSSDIAPVAGLTPKNKPWRQAIDVYMTKTHLAPDFAGNWKTKKGDHMESFIAQWYATEVGAEELIQGETMTHPTETWIMATPDFWVVFEVSPKRLVEIKDVGFYVVHHWDKGVPDYVAAQVYWQQVVTGCEYTDVAASLGGDEPRYWQIEWNPEIHKDLIEIGRDFWFEHVLKRMPPEPDDSEQYADFLRSSFRRHNTDIVRAPAEADDWVSQRQQALVEAEMAERKKIEAENNLKAIIGENAGVWSRGFRATWVTTKSGGTDWKGLALSLGATPEHIAQFQRSGNRHLTIQERKHV